MRKTTLTLIACAMLLQGCLGIPTREALPSPDVPHQLAEDVDAYIWVRTDTNEWARQRVSMRKGDWVMSDKGMSK